MRAIVKSGRGLHALQDASRRTDTCENPPGLGVRAVLCRFVVASLIASITATLPTRASASEPSSTYNADGEVRSRTCTPLLLPTAPLRFSGWDSDGFLCLWR